MFGCVCFSLLLSIIAEHDDASNIKLSIVSILNDRDDDMTHLVFSYFELNAPALSLSPSLSVYLSLSLSPSPFFVLFSPSNKLTLIPVALPSCHFIWIMYKAIWLWLCTLCGHERLLSLGACVRSPINFFCSTFYMSSSLTIRSHGALFGCVNNKTATQLLILFRSHNDSVKSLRNK